MSTADEQRTTLLALYPLFKEEVYRRREQMMRWTAIGAGSMFTILIVLLLVPERGRLSLSGRALIAGAIVLLAATFAALILQHQQRHRQAKQTLIELERALGLFDADIFLSQRPLYPDHWQTDWTSDHSTTLSLLLLGLLAFLALLATALAS
ncbi:MAG: hypothetical protein EWM72_02799 [Nitrospira sp.]|nr:MAG: hypothetical protein EWM72_02799 [Nitrospira sp.]